MPATPTRDRVNPEAVNTAPLRRPEWIRVRAPVGRNLRAAPHADARQVAAHGVRGGHVPEHGRMLGFWHRHLPDAGQRVHALVRLLRHQAWQTQPDGLARAGTRRAGGQVDESEARRDHLRQPRRTPRRRRADLRHGHPPHPRAAPRLFGRGADPGFQGLARGAEDRHGRAP